MNQDQATASEAPARRALPRYVLTSLVGLAALLLAALAVATPATSTTPGSPGTAQPGTPVYSETFSNAAATKAIALGSYTGSAGTAGADSETYSATGGYRSTSNQCDGWILNSTTTKPTTDAGCTTTAWSELKSMADILGLAQGQSAAQAADNQALADYTNDKAVNPGAGVELETNTNTIPATAGHFYTVSGYFAEVNCGSSQAKEDFYLLEDGAPVEVGTNLDPCTAPGNQSYTTKVGGTSVTASVSHLVSSALQLPATGTPILGLDLYDAQTSGDGNDVAFDLPQIVDVTPQLDKSFSPTTIPQGGTSTLTYTITNTSELDAKDDWSFTDDLPADLTATGVNSTTCSSGSISAAAGATTVTVTKGDLDKRQTTCTVSVQVSATVVGTYTNSAGNFPSLIGVNPPGKAVLTVIPVVDLTIAKSANVADYVAGDPITYTVTVNNNGPSTANGATVTDPLPASITGATWTCSATSGASCTASGTGSISDTVTIPAGGTVTYTVTGTVASDTTGDVVNTATVVPPSGTSDPDCLPSPGVGCSASVTTPATPTTTTTTIAGTTTTTTKPPTTTTTFVPKSAAGSGTTTTTTTTPYYSSTGTKSTTQPISIISGHPGTTAYVDRAFGLAGLALAMGAVALMGLLFSRRRRA